MSVTAVRAALETALNAMSPALATAWENRAFTPTVGTPYQRINVIFAAPLNDEISRAHAERGFMQVGLSYPAGDGPGAAAARAELIRTTFYRGATFISGGVTVTINRTPEVGQGQPDGDRWFVPVRIPFFAPVAAA